MTLETINTNDWHRVHDQDLGDAEREAIAEAFQAYADKMRANGFKVLNDDRAEMVVAVMTKMHVEANWTGGARCEPAQCEDGATPPAKWSPTGHSA